MKRDEEEGVETEVTKYYCKWLAQLSFLKVVGAMQGFTNRYGQAAITHDHLLSIVDLSFKKYKAKVQLIQMQGQDPS